MRDFFENSDFLDIMVLKPLSHIRPDWELSWYGSIDEYKPSVDSFAYELQQLIYEIEACVAPDDYHLHEDIVIKSTPQEFNEEVYKQGRLWIGQSYQILLQNGGLFDDDAKNLVMATAGRIAVAKRHGQLHFDQMDFSHQKILAIIMALVLYHRFT